MATRRTARPSPDSGADRASAATPGGGAQTGVGALERLLDTERDFVERLAAADRDAAAILEEARTTAERREREFARELEQEITDLRHRLASECTQAVGETEAAAAREAARFDAMSGERIAAFADSLLDHLFAPGNGSTSGASS